jgi:FkbM family methyltransferase
MNYAAFGRRVSRMLQAYYNGPDHPLKVRLWNQFRNLTRFRRIVVPYGRAGWLTLDERDLIQRSILNSGAYEHEVWTTLSRYADRDEVLWDIGANIGSVTVAAAQCEAVGDIHAFEPDPDLYQLLRQHLVLNGNRGVAHDLAIGDRQGAVVLSRAPVANAGLGSIARQVSREAIEVRCATVDSLVFEGGLSAPTLMKIDVEGAERAVLFGSQRLLAESPPKAIVFETSVDEWGHPRDAELIEFLNARGFAVARVVRPNGVIDLAENLVAAHASSGGLTRLQNTGIQNL